MVGQVEGAQLLIRNVGGQPKTYKYDAIITDKSFIKIGLSQTNADVCRNTLLYSILRRKLKDGTFNGFIEVQFSDHRKIQGKYSTWKIYHEQI